MRKLWNAFLPYDPNRSWITTLGQVAIMGFIGSFIFVFAIVFSPIWLGFLAYYVGESAVRGLRNRWVLFTRGDVKHSTLETHWWDGIIHLALWAAIGALLGRACADWNTALALGAAGFAFGCLMELVYNAADGMVLPPADVGVIPRQKWQNTYVGNGDTENVNRSANNNDYSYRKTVPWQWAGYQVDRGPKEDVLFPLESE